jgi:hypothetical protein
MTPGRGIGERIKRPVYGFAFADCIAYLPETHWDVAAASGGFFMSRATCKFWNKPAPANYGSVMRLIYLGARPLAAVCIQMGEISAAQFNKQRSKLRGGLERIRARYLICGNLLSPGDSTASRSLRHRTGRRLAGGGGSPIPHPPLGKVDRRNGLVMVKDIAEPKCRIPSRCAAIVTVRLPPAPNMILTFSTADQKLRGLFWRASTTATGKIGLNRFSTGNRCGGCTSETLQDLPAHADTLHVCTCRCMKRPRSGR